MKIKLRHDTLLEKDNTTWHQPDLSPCEPNILKSLISNTYIQRLSYLRYLKISRQQLSVRYPSLPNIWTVILHKLYTIRIYSAKVYTKDLAFLLSPSVSTSSLTVTGVPGAS